MAASKRHVETLEDLVRIVPSELLHGEARKRMQKVARGLDGAIRLGPDNRPMLSESAILALAEDRELFGPGFAESLRQQLTRTAVGVARGNEGRPAKWLDVAAELKGFEPRLDLVDDLTSARTVDDVHALMRRHAPELADLLERRRDAIVTGAQRIARPDADAVAREGQSFWDCMRSEGALYWYWWVWIVAILAACLAGPVGEVMFLTWAVFVGVGVVIAIMKCLES